MTSIVSSFKNCTGLTSITIPSSVSSIDNYAFARCSGLLSLKVDDENEKYDSRDNCNAIIDSYTNNLIRGCKTTVIPQTVTKIGVYAFAGCVDLRMINIPNSVLSIREGAFEECTSLNTLKIGSSVEYIGVGAFQDCNGLTSIIIPNKVNSIDMLAFSRCKAIQNVYCYGEIVPSVNDDTFLETPIENATLHVPFSSVEMYKQTASWSGFGKIIALTDDDPKPTGILPLTLESVSYPIDSYTVDGKRYANPKNGLIILRMNDGKTKKMFMK